MKWNGCRAVTDDLEVSAWLQGKRLDPRAIANRDLARSISAPPRLVIPHLRPDGTFAGLYRYPVKGRSANGSSPPAPKAGRVLANLIGRGLLLQGQAPDWWTWRTILLVDDLVEFLSWGSSYADTDDVPAVFLVPPEGWDPAFSKRMPEGSRVIVRTLQPPATSMLSDLSPRCEVIVRR
jgi:hypothetical protein